MAAQTPVVATDTALSRSLIDDGENGLLVSHGDTAALTAAIESVFDQPQSAAQRAVAARERVAERYSIERMAKRHLELFREIISFNR